MKTKPQTKIIALMKWKQDQLKEIAYKLNTKLPTKYLTGKDIKDIKSWSDEEAQNIWEFLVSELNFTSFSEDYVFASWLCPFCYYYKFNYKSVINNRNCNTCTYGKNHGICTNEYENVDYDKIVTWLNDNAMIIKFKKLEIKVSRLKNFLYTKYPQDFEKE